MVYVEALDHYLEVFVSFLGDPDALPPSLLSAPLVQVFDAYLKTKLISPRGWRGLEREDGEIFELEEDDRDAFSDQLSSIGSIARAVPHHSLPLLTRSVGQCVESCLGVLGMLRRDPGSLYSQQNTLDSTHEDLHWLVLIAGFTLCDVVKGENVLIPPPLMKHSIQRHKDMGSESTVQDVAGLVWKEGGTDQVVLNTPNLDPIVALFLSVCRLCMVEKLFINQGLIDVVSPQLSSTLVWCLGHVTKPYLHLSEDSYDQVSLPMLSVFGKDASSSQWLCLFLLDKITFNLSVWSGEEKVVLNTIQLLASLVKNTERVSVVIKSEMMWSLMRRFSSGDPTLTALPPRGQRDLISSLVQCGVGETRQHYLTQLLQPLQQRFSALVQSPTFHTASHEAPCVQELLCLLEALCGLAHNSRPALVEEFFNYLHPLLQLSVQLLEVYRDTPEVIGVILELFALTAENYIVFLKGEQTLDLYKVCLDLIQSYTKTNTSKYSRAAGIEEEEQCDDLLHFLKMMTHLTIKDYVDFGDSDAVVVKPVDVVITGLNAILPLMTEEILKFPSLCRQFYTLVNYICESFPERLPSLPDQLFLSCMHLLESGLHDYGVEVTILCLESIEGVAVCRRKDEALQSSPALTHILEHFLKVIFEMMLSSSFDMDIIHSTSSAVYAIICSNKESYLSLANTLITSQADPENQSRLMEAFSSLTPPSLPLDSKRTSKITFRKNLEQFLPFVKGFLCYK